METILPSAEWNKSSVACLLGAAGLGKTHELNRCVQAERDVGKDVRTARLASLACEAAGLGAALVRVSKDATPETVIFLDAVDESMVPDRFTALRLSGWIRESLTAAKPRLRLSCRSAVWPTEVMVALRDVYGQNNIKVVVLEPLDSDSIRRVAGAAGVDADAFLSAVAQAGAHSLTQHPLTLKMLLKVFGENLVLPNNRSELFDQGVRRLAEERAERREVKTTGAVPPDTILKVAEHVACFTLLSGRELVDLADEGADGTLSLAEITSASPSGDLLTPDTIEALAASGLCEGDGGRRFGFIHRQFAEYLAGRALARLLPHQARSLLETGLGWKYGVAGPLRETAAFAANGNAGIADWMADRDPSVIGLSGVADAGVRRRASLALLDKFRRRELTDSQVRSGRSEFVGLKYDGAADDLRGVLKERFLGCEDVLECAVELVREWKLSALSPGVADLMLDPTAPHHPRVAAGYALAEMGESQDKRRVKALLQGEHDDPDWQLRGLALRCNWPDGLTVAEMLEHLQPRRRSSFSGAYEGFLFDLDRQEFDAEGAREKGLAWAVQQYRRGEDHDPAVRVAMRIAHAALNDLDNPAILNGLAELMFEASRAHAKSPLRPFRKRALELDVDDADGEESPLEGRKDVRRRLVGAMVAKASKDDHLWWIVRETPHLLESDDFEWLLGQALDAALPDAVRQQYAELARGQFQWDEARVVDAWLAVRDQEPVRSVLSYPVVTVIDSDQAREMKRQWAASQRVRKPKKPKPITPPPAERIQDLLERCESKDFRHFHTLCRELTLNEDKREYELSRFLIDSPGWQNSTAETRGRIVDAAKKFLEADTETCELATTAPLNSILSAGMAAMWLVEAVDNSTAGETAQPSWLESRDDAWWTKWTWFILREPHPNLMGEPDDGKRALLAILRKRMPSEVVRHFERLARGEVEESRELLRSLFTLLEDTDDPELDRVLCAMIESGGVAADRVGDVAGFVLRQSAPEACRICVARLEVLADGKCDGAEDPAVTLAIALLCSGDLDSWDKVIKILDSRDELNRLVLGGFAHSERWRRRKQGAEEAEDALVPEQIGKLTRLLIRAFPPESDPNHDGAHWVGPDDSARDLRNRLLSRLGDQADGESVAVLRELEAELGTKYPWLRRPRARAEEGYRLAHWNPIPPKLVVQVLNSADKRLIRSSQDALEGIAEAIRLYERSLRSQAPSPLDDLWNTPAGQAPSPKVEERASDKICEAIRAYFAARAVVADREVQVRRRQVAKDLGGEPGSRPDVLVTIPRMGSDAADDINVPVEVKLSGNPEARTGLSAQLADRYVAEVGSDVGVFVVMWMAAPDMRETPKPRWPSIEEARAELEQQAKEASTSGRIRIDAIVVDCSLR